MFFKVFDTNRFHSQKLFQLKLCAPQKISKWTSGQLICMVTCNFLTNNTIKISQSVFPISKWKGLTLTSLQKPCSSYTIT